MKKKLFGIPLTFLLIGVLVVGGVTAALLTLFVDVNVSADVKQSVVFSDGDTSKTYGFDGSLYAGNGFSEVFTLKNRAGVEAPVEIETTGVVTGIDVGYFTLLGYEDTQNTPTKEVVVTDLGDKVEWVITYDGDDAAYNNGHASMSLVIADDSGVVYQIHSNDGSDASYDWGTWLYSPYSVSLSSGCEWNGWHSSCLNVEVSDLDWVSASGERYKVDNPAYEFIITIDKSRLEGDTFRWVVSSNQDGVFTNPGFGWSSVDVNNMHEAVVGEEITNPFVIFPSQEFDFVSVFKFHVALTPDMYNIETKVVPQ